FEYFYGFLGGDANQWAPAIFENIKPVEPPHDQKDYFFDNDMADHAIARIRLLHAVAPQKPWVTYYAPGTAHAPHHAPKESIAKFKGKFDMGWDKMREITFEKQKHLGIIPQNAKLTPRPAQIPAWDSFDADHKKVFARMMEIYAAALSHCDEQMGRVLDAIDEMGDLDNTLVIYIQGDNGASAEGTPQGLLNELSILNGIPEDFNQILKRMDELGGPMTYNHYPVGWAHAMDTPFQWTKQIASHFGGTRNGLVISWPARIKDKGGIRTQFHHVIDIAPTILEATGVQAPAVLNGVPQKPIEGVSMVYSFDNAKAPSTHHTQYFEMFANRAIYNEGWVAATTPPIAPWVMGKTVSIDDYKWELYDVSKDFSQSNNLAAKEPRKLRELQELFWIEAAKHDVLPLDNSKLERFDVSQRPSLTRGRAVFSYEGNMVRITEGSAPDLKNKSFKIGAEVKIPESGAQGVLMTQGGRFSGLGLYVLEGRPVFHYNTVGIYRYTIAGKDKLAPGAHTLLVDFKYDGGGVGKGGTATLLVDGKEVAKGRIERTTPFRVALDETLDIGEDTGTPVSEDYQVPFKFTGELKKVAIQLTDSKLSAEDEEEIRKIRAEIALSE
ncbi:MAG: sulfatase-like hydrolase/transferase, partial [Myxococcales bacterium]